MPVEALVLFWTKDCTRADASEHSVFRCSHPHPPWRRRATPSRRRTRRSVAKPLDFDDSSSSAPSKNVSLMLVNAFWGTFATSSSPSSTTLRAHMKSCMTVPANYVSYEQQREGWGGGGEVGGYFVGICEDGRRMDTGMG
ncbi:hypothetical protein R3P38DRAFT_3197425 [Favolaschia claudopus]|uniref:Uncharacterized protein n=1 Tax=Favolaschia claudopus TaxID=2862362 RepID=A0AAW0B4H0_9AGAR